MLPMNVDRAWGAVTVKYSFCSSLSLKPESVLLGIHPRDFEVEIGLTGIREDDGCAEPKFLLWIVRYGIAYGVLEVPNIAEPKKLQAILNRLR